MRTKRQNQRTLKIKRRLNGGDGDNNDNDCPICYENMNNTNSIVLHAADIGKPHKFHKTCIAPMLNEPMFDVEGNPAELKCPYCQIGVNKDEIRNKIGTNVTINAYITNFNDLINRIRSIERADLVSGIFIICSASLLVMMNGRPLVPLHGGGEKSIKSTTTSEDEKNNIIEFHEKFLFVPKENIDIFIKNCQNNSELLEEALRNDGHITILYTVKSSESKSKSKSKSKAEHRVSKKKRTGIKKSESAPLLKNKIYI
jgi:hypothetical protein